MALPCIVILPAASRGAFGKELRKKKKTTLRRSCTDVLSYLFLASWLSHDSSNPLAQWVSRYETERRLGMFFTISVASVMIRSTKS
jgi:hypothetical protein